MFEISVDKLFTGYSSGCAPSMYWGKKTWKQSEE